MRGGRMVMKHKTSKWVALVTVLVIHGVCAQLAFAEDAVTQSEAKAAQSNGQKGNQKDKKKTTEVSFEDVLVQGKYHFSDEAVTTVEQDKVLDALLGVRTDFKDRLKKSTSRQ